MSKIRRFEDLESWKQSRVFVKEVYLLLRELKELDKDTKSQLRRAALSIMNNIAEGFARYSEKDFIRFLNISSSSAAEVKSMFYLLYDLEFIDDKKLDKFHSSIEDIRKLIHGLIRYMNSKNNKL